MARPRKEIEEGQLRGLCRLKPTKADVAAFFSCSEDTIENRVKELGYPSFSAFRDENMVHTRFSLIRKAISKAEAGDNVMLIFTLKNLCGWADRNEPAPKDEPLAPVANQKKSFEDFCETAGYPRPFPMQVEMKNFAIMMTDPRILLGARGYGKTDYMTILGVAYDIYCDPEKSTNLIISKSKTRNTAMLEEIANALSANGIRLEKRNSSCIRVAGLVGKDHSVEVLTIKSSFRGRHPLRILMDDPVTEEDTSDAVRAMVKKKYDEAYKLCKNICVIGQPAHAFDLYSDLRPILKKMEVPHGTIPQLDADLEAMKLAGVDLNSIEMSYHLRVPKNSTSSFAEVLYLDSFPARDSVAFIDPSFEGGDYTAMTVLTSHFDGVAVQGHVWKMAWNHCIDEMAEKMRALGVRKLCFETNSLGDQPLQLLRQHEGLKGIGIMGKRSTENKHARIMAAGVFAKLIHLSQNSDKIYIDQVVKYEYKAKFDDAPDSLASCMEWVGLIKGKSR
jgi:uncharacterized protein YbcV (DUF1398 family)